MSSERENNYDLLRLICVLAVITNHVSDITLEWSNSYKWVTYFWEGLGAYAVPCFLMITGAFSINNPNNCNAKVYWARVYKKIGIPTAIFSVFYFLWYFSLSYYKTGGGDILKALHKPLYLLLTGWYGHPLWYVYTLMGIYLFIPLVCEFRNKYKDSTVYWIFMGGYVIWSFLSMYGVHSNISWSITHVFSYLGFVLLGSIIKDLWKRKSNCIGICMIVSGELLSILAWEMAYWSNIMHLGWNIKIFTGTFSPISIFIYILIFGGITMLKIQQNFKIIVKYSLYIYLFHKFILEIGAYVVKNWGLIILNNPYSYIPVMVTIVFMTSLLFSTIYLAGNNFIQLILKKRRDCDGI